jgi:S-methylmethionine-dependent homocysteine/selenocysteine methylase
MTRNQQDVLHQLDTRLFMSDGGLETTLIFHEKMELPLLAAFPLLLDDFGRNKLLDYFRRYGELAARYKLGFILESPTWRAQPDWTSQFSSEPGYLEDVNRRSIQLMEQIRAEYQDRVPAILISGNLGPRGDGYIPSKVTSAREAEKYHSQQIAAFAQTAVDMVSAFTLNYVEEAIGITRAALRHQLPVVISFTVETDGKLPTGQTLKEAIESVDAATHQGPAYYMINCSHPTHFADALRTNEAWLRRLRGIRANASSCSHAELNDSPDLDTGNPADLGRRYLELQKLLPRLAVIGGCCGTDHRHIAAMCSALTRNAPAFLRAAPRSRSLE